MLSDGRFYKEDVFIKCVVCLPVPSLTAHTEITEKVSFGQMMIYSDVELDEVRGDGLCKRHRDVLSMQRAVHDAEVPGP